MFKHCGKQVHILRTLPWITRVRLSPGFAITNVDRQSSWYNPSFVPDLFQFFPQLFPQAPYHFLPLIEHKFYPVSTAPITNPAKERYKER